MIYSPFTRKLDYGFEYDEGDARYLKLDQTTPQTFSAGTVAGSGLLNVTAGVLGLDTSTYLTSETDPVFSGWLSSTPPLYPGGWYDTDQSNVYMSYFYNDAGYLTYWDSISYADTSNYSYYSDSAYMWNGYYMPDPYSGTSGYLYTDGYGTLSWGAIDMSSLSQDLYINGWSLYYGGTSEGLGYFLDSNNSELYIDHIREHTTGHGVNFSDGTSEMTIGGTNGLSYVQGVNSLVYTLASGGRVWGVDVGSTDLEPLARVTRSSTNTVIPVWNFSRSSTGTAGDGIGGAIPLYLLNDNGDEEIFGQIEWIGTDVSDGSEDSDVVIKTITGGSLTTALTLRGDGIVLPHLMQSDSTDQSISSATAEQVITFNGDIHHSEITRTSSSRFTITKSGSYLITFSILAQSSVAGKQLAVWMKKGGTNVADSATYYTFKANNATAVITVTFIYHFDANDYFEFWMWGNDTGIKLDATAALAASAGVNPAVPACPSIIMTCNFVGKD